MQTPNIEGKARTSLGATAPASQRRIALVGGDEFRPDCVDMDTALLAAAGVGSPHVLIVPTAAAMSRPDLAAKNGEQHFAALGAKVSSLMALNSGDANDDALVSMVDNADLVYLTGGNPAHLLDVLKGSLLLDKIHGALERGAVLAGSSAGAMVLGQRMRFRGQWSDALGALPGVAIMPHHEGSDPDETLAELGDVLREGLVVLGIDAATGVISADDNSVWQVVGKGGVTCYSAHQHGDGHEIRGHGAHSGDKEHPRRWVRFESPR